MRWIRLLCVSISVLIAVGLAGPRAAAEEPSVGAEFGYDGAGFDPALCEHDAEGAIWIKTGDSLFAVPRDAFEKALMRHVGASDPQTRVTKTSGCPERPLDAAFFIIAARAFGGARPARVMWAGPPDRVAQTREMFARMRAAAACRRAKTLLICPGSQSVGGAQRQVMWMIAPDPEFGLESGAPFAVFCLLDGPVTGCEARDEISQHVRVALAPVIEGDEANIAFLRAQIEAASRYAVSLKRQAPRAAQ